MFVTKFCSDSLGLDVPADAAGSNPLRLRAEKPDKMIPLSRTQPKREQATMCHRNALRCLTGHRQPKIFASGRAVQYGRIAIRSIDDHYRAGRLTEFRPVIRLFCLALPRPITGKH